MKFRKWLAASLVLIVTMVAGMVWWRLGQTDLPAGFASGNGRIEATEIDIASKYPGRLAEVLIGEGDTVAAGQVVARMDTAALEAQLKQAEARVKQAQDAKRTAEAVVAQRKSEQAFANRQLDRSRELLLKGFITREKHDSDETRAQTAQAALLAAQSQITEAASAIEAAAADGERLKAELADGMLKAPRRGRVQYRLAEPGEVLAAGGKVLTLLDLGDVSMTLFLPESQAGRVALGEEARIVLDAAPQYVIPAKVSFVADQAQFTPKQVETRSEREKLMFRVKLKIDPGLLKQYEAQVKTGLPGIAYVRLDRAAVWPDKLAVKLPR
ncbi:MAG: HlyD family efflux transporter periplasmic adaptor subunit [Gammaproteobacteria bacterium]